MLVAILEKKGGLKLSSSDIFVNVAGGFKLEEPAADLAIAMALASSFVGEALPSKLVFVGEMGLAGEIRGVTQGELRSAEAHKLGFEGVMMPEVNCKQIPKKKQRGLQAVRSLGESLVQVFPAEVFVG